MTRWAISTHQKYTAFHLVISDVLIMSTPLINQPNPALFLYPAIANPDRLLPPAWH